MNRLVDALFLFQETVECVGKARNRLWGAVPPASKAEREYKDCEIFEEFLELITALRNQGFNHATVFVTPNKDDYGPAPDGHAEIGSDLTACNATYVANLSWARASLQISDFK